MLLVEEDAVVRDHILKAVRGATPAQAFANLDALDGAVIHPGRPVLLVLGPSQATPDVLDRVGALLKATEGAGAVLVVEHSSTALMRIALRSGVNDAIELSQIGAQLPDALDELAFRLEDELAAPPAKHAAGRNAAPASLRDHRVLPEGGRRQVGDCGEPGYRTGADVWRASGGPGPRPAVRRRRGNAQVAARAYLHRRRFGRRGSWTKPSCGASWPATTRAGSRSWPPLHRLRKPTRWTRPPCSGYWTYCGVCSLMSSIDTPPHLSEVVLQAVAESDLVCFVVEMDVPSVKNARLGLQAFELLQLPLAKVVLLLNRANSKVHLKPDDIERVLEMKVDIALPSDAAVPQSVNQGVPALLEYPRSQYAAQIDQLAGLVLARSEEASSSVTVAKR